MNEHLIEIDRVKDLMQAQVVREIRNHGRHNMTANTDEISSKAQEKWWAKVKDNPDFSLFLYSIDLYPAGFGMLRREEDHYLLTLAIYPEYRGMGLGRFIYHHLACVKPHDTIIADILTSNIPSIRAAEHAGFTLKKSVGPIVTLQRRGEK